MVESLDDSVGRVMCKLRELGLETNTIVIFTSDNGGLSTAEGWPTSNLPLRTGKALSHEGAIREPLIVKWPGIDQARQRLCQPDDFRMDYYPTLLQMAGLPLLTETTPRRPGASCPCSKAGHGTGTGVVLALSALQSPGRHS